VRIIVNKWRCYVAPSHLYSSISIIDFVYIVQNDCMIWYMSSATTYTPFYSVSRWWYDVGSGIKSFFSLFLYIYVWIIIVRRTDYSMMLEAVFFFSSFSWLKWKSCENRLSSLSLYIYTSIIHFHTHIIV
jgi:hypothetical protein